MKTSAIATLFLIACTSESVETPASRASEALVEDPDSGAASLNLGTAPGTNAFAANYGYASGERAFAANSGAARGNDSAAFGTSTVDDAGTKGFAQGHASHVSGPNGVALNMATVAGTNAFACIEDSFAYAYRSLACGEGAIAHAPASIALGAGVVTGANAMYSTALGQASQANLPGQLAFASGSIDSNTAFLQTEKGAAQWSTLVMRATTPGEECGELVAFAFANASNNVLPGSANAAYIVEDSCVATTTCGTRMTRVHVQRHLVEVVDGVASVIDESAPLEMGSPDACSWTWTKVPTMGGWFTRFSTGSTTAAVRVVCTEHFTHVWLP